MEVPSSRAPGSVCSMDPTIRGPWAEPPLQPREPHDSGGAAPSLTPTAPVQADRPRTARKPPGSDKVDGGTISISFCDHL